MKRNYLLIVSFIGLFGTAFAQDDAAFNKKYDPIRAELEEWDPIRGPWLSSSLEAMSKGEAIPDRTFPEDLTPAQMVSALPTKTRNSIEQTAMASNATNPREVAQWKEIKRVIVRPGAGCGTRTARTYGDPHMVTFDGARYSFQTVGEFVLTKSTGGIEVQGRQRPQRDDFSLNTAVAMNVGGDRVCLYASDFPDGDRSTPLRVNGRAVRVSPGKAYFLSNGGTVRQTGRTYTVAWPTGETVTSRMSTTGGMDFMSINVQITGCTEGIISGLLGNANGRESDDFQGMNDNASLRMAPGNDPFGGVSREMEQRRLAFLANAMADEYRVTQMTTLFDYPPGTNTLTFTDRSFPRVHRTINEIPRDRRDAARANCQRQGVLDRDMNGCIFDNSHLNIPPQRPVVVQDPSQGIELRPVSRPAPNVNGPETASVDPGEIHVIDHKETTKPRLTPMPIAKPEKERADRVERTEPAKETRSEPESIYTAPARSEPVRTTPTRSEPVRTTPTRTEPVRTAPVRTAPVRTAPVRTTPVRTTPSRPKPSAPKPSVKKGGR
ncbi:MAG: hypothetical protein ACI837_002529 [Crocinitomicaceae bacterium]|jgi:hypothetical protein